jgi:hypothetical protein
MATVVVVAAGFVIRGLPREDMVDGDEERVRHGHDGLLVPTPISVRTRGTKKPAAFAGPRRAGRIADLHAARVGAAPMTISVLQDDRAGEARQREP